MEGKQNSRSNLLFLRPILFSLAIVAGTAVISAGLYLGLPPGLSGIALSYVFLDITLWLVYRAWGEGSCRAEVAVWLTALLSVLGTIVLEAGACHILLRAGLPGLSGATYVQCSANYLGAGRFEHAFFGFLVTLAFWADIRYTSWKRRRLLKQVKMMVPIVVWRGKAYLVCYGQIEPGFFREMEPIYVVDIDGKELLSAIQKISAAGLPHIPSPTTREEAERLSRAASILKATGARSRKELVKTGALYAILETDKETRVEMSRLDKKGRWEFDPGKRRIFPPDTPLEEIVAVILEDIRSRPEVWVWE